MGANQSKEVLIIGAGLCGTLLAIRLAQRGYAVEVFEKRPDMRNVSLDAGRSINLALSVRGLKALELVGLKEEVLQQCIPMPGRMIHAVDGQTFFSNYSGRPDECINSVSRTDLNIALLNKAASYPNLKLVFDSTCVNVDLEKAEASFVNNVTMENIHKSSGVIFGTDGANSALRQSMMPKTNQLLFNYSQDFLRHGYKELSIPPEENGGFRIEKNALHIWPRGSYMVIALPNLDGSFTVTLFLGFDGLNGFNSLTTKEAVLSFFEDQFPDLLPHTPSLIDDFFNNKTGSLGTIKCYPWQAFGKTLLLGDAAHAIVPFYGQGMNASFEDVVVLDEVIDSKSGDWNDVFVDFQERRAVDTNAIADLAIDNFYEMRDHVANPVFMKKRKLEMALEKAYPAYYSKYSMVTFKDDISYAEAMDKGRKQDMFLMEHCKNHEVDDISLDDLFKRLSSIV